jgi:hypothetical protein
MGTLSNAFTNPTITLATITNPINPIPAATATIATTAFSTVSAATTATACTVAQDILQGQCMPQWVGVQVGCVPSLQACPQLLE